MSDHELIPVHPSRLGCAITAWCHANRVPFAEFARRAGVSLQSVYLVRRYPRTVRRFILQRMADVLAVPVETLAGEGVE